MRLHLCVYAECTIYPQALTQKAFLLNVFSGGFESSQHQQSDAKQRLLALRRG